MIEVHIFYLNVIKCHIIKIAYKRDIDLAQANCSNENDSYIFIHFKIYRLLSTWVFKKKKNNIQNNFLI